MPDESTNLPVGFNAQEQILDMIYAELDGMAYSCQLTSKLLRLYLEGEED
jgi:hypothetical protein